MLEKSATLEERDLGTNPLTEKELDQLIGGRDHKEFLNTRNELYRARKMKEKPPSREEALRLMAKEPNLIRRPILIKGSKMVIGWNAEEAERLL